MCLFCFENVLVNGESENLTFEIKIVLNRSSFEEYVILTHLLKDAHEIFSQGFARRALLPMLAVKSNNEHFVIVVYSYHF